MRVIVAAAALAVPAVLLIPLSRLSGAGDAAAAPPSTEAVVASGLRVFAASTPFGQMSFELPWGRAGDAGAAVSPDGTRLAFASARTGSSEIYVADARTGVTTRLTDNPGADDAGPAWSPDGRRVAWATGQDGAHDIWVMGADGSGKRLLVGGAGDDIEPAWSPDGMQVAFASSRDGRYELWALDAAGGEPTRLFEAPGRQWAPAWSPDGRRIAYTGVVNGESDVWSAPLDTLVPRRLTTAPGFDGRPAWSPDGRRMAFASTRGGSQRIWVMNADGSGQRALATSRPGDDDPQWATLDAAMVPSADQLLPDLDQQAPSELVVKAVKGRIRLGFTSAVDNVGAGPMHVKGTRGPGESTMRADQLIETTAGSRVVVRAVGRLAFEPHPPHHHWHLEPYETYELYRASDRAPMGRDRKSGFCLLDRWGRALKRPGLVFDVPRFTGDCATGRPGARTVDEGTSVGYTDRYPGFFHGQDVDITDLDPGLYVLVHRSNPERLLREVRYSNNEASVLIRLTGPLPKTGLPGVRVLARCPASDWCAASG